MHGIKLNCKKVTAITKTEVDNILSLHDKAFNIPQKTVLEALKTRDCMYIYTEKKTKKIIGCAAAKWLHADDKNVILYLGHAIIDPLYKNHGLFSKIQLRAVIKSIKEYPGKHLYCAGLVATPESFAYVKHLAKYWPNNKDTASPLTYRMMLTVARNIAANHYHLHNGNIIVDKLSTEYNNRIIYKKSHNTKYSNIVKEFEVLNPNYQHGNQLLMLGQFSILNILFLVYRNIMHYMKNLIKFKYTAKLKSI